MDLIEEDINEASMLAAIPSEGTQDEEIVDYLPEAPCRFNSDEIGQPGDKDQDLWIEVAKCSSLTEADIICGRLQAEGINVYFKNEYSAAIGMLGFPGMCSGEFSLLTVPVEQAEKAFAILNEMQHKTESTFSEEELD